MVLKKSGRGSVGRAFSSRKRYKEDGEYREKCKESARKNHHKNRDKELARLREWTKKLNEFANKKCVVCNKLLNYRTKSNLCQKHWREEAGKM